MKRRLFLISAFFAVLIIAVTGILYFDGQGSESPDTKGEQIVAVNEMTQLARLGEFDKMSEKAEKLVGDLRTAQTISYGNGRLFWLCGITLLFLIIVFGYIYYAIIRPFGKMEKYAQEIAKGNFDIPLDYERSNYFGEFTWAFDSMRREIVKARSCEKEAIENNKTVIATLSHDIKTPISSIRAYAEGLEANMDSTIEKREKYLSVIMKKCDEVSKLTNDLFIHSLSDLDKLKINSEDFELCDFIKNTVNEIAAEQNDVHFKMPDFTAVVSADKNRVVQIIENLINNARKYAKSDIDVFMVKSDGSIEVHFRDYGFGIPDEDMPFIFEKFYRGGNCGNEQGSGLGLYIVKYLTEQMHGNILLYNHPDGLETIISLPIIK